MIKLFSCLFVSFTFLISCSNKVIHEKEQSEIKIEYPENVKTFLTKFSDFKKELNIDQKFIDDTIRNHTKQELTLDEVKLLAENMSKDKNTESNSYYLRDYYKIQSAKLEDKYEEYVSNLDIGMMKNANCYALGKIEFGDSLALLVWKIDFDSYEACPYYHGSHFLGTIVANGKIVQTIQLAAKENAADAPMVSETKHYVKIFKNGKLSMKSESIVEEEEVEIEHYEDKFDFLMTKNGFIKK